MEELKNNKNFKILAWLFIIVSMIHVIYATITMRGMFMDGGFYMLELLNRFSDNQHAVAADFVNRTRFFISYLMQIPVLFAHGVLAIQNKWALMMIYSFSQFFLPLLAVYWVYKLARRVNRPEMFFWSLLLYSGFLITSMIFSVVETHIGSPLHFLLWIYLSTTMKYTKKDIIAIIFLITVMFATFEYVVGLGIIFALASIYYVCKEPEKKNKIIKALIGLGSLSASIFDIMFMFSVPGEAGEIMRFLKETYDFIHNMWNMNIMFTVISIFLIGLAIFRKKLFTTKNLIFISLIFVCLFIRLINIKHFSIYPMWEIHLRSIPCWLIPIMFTCFLFSDIKNIKINKILLSNAICIMFLCGTFQSCWQMVNTYYWDKNIQYMKSELAQHDGILYLPNEHPEIGYFHNEELRRYIIHGAYTFTSILFSDEYAPKTVLMTYDKQLDAGDNPFREALYVGPEENTISIPYGTKIQIVNRYWDLTEFAQALEKYNKENNIQTWQ